MGVAVNFDYALWSARYPEFCSVSSAQAQAYFTEATLYFRNDGTGPICNADQQLLLLNMLTAHIAALNSGINGQPASPLVGRVNSASEGSVSVGTDLQLPQGSAQWYAQTKYGFAFWQATAALRTFRYAPNVKNVANPYFYQR